uniref:WW domain-containing protein n=1 Tax=Globisporangium ultimum (strain ATCC 200006 / CBS 805.95 / DAOM BR144) TaxID=431595 RepID=K3WWK2_GLOUD
MWRHNSTASLDTATVTEDGEKLPPGWTRKESKTQKGRYYYISPAGKTQWTAPPVKSSPKVVIPQTYNWVSAVEIEFGEGRLGVSLREVRQLDTTPYPQFQAEVDDLPKVNGKAGPAELYNWSVKPHKRLTIGMRVTGIEDTVLAGLTYKEVVDKLKKASRPLKIHFADVEKGTVEDNPELAMMSDQESKENGQSSVYMQQKQEFTRVLVTSELHTELWTIETKKLLRSMNVMKKKWETVSGEFDILNERRLDLRKENDRLISEKQKYDTMIKHLKLQEVHAMENPELIKANELARRNAELTEDIAKMSAGNKRLRKERVTLQTALDEVENTLAKLDKTPEEEEEKGGDDEFFGIDLSAPPAEQLAAFKKKMRFMEDELNKEQRKAAKVQREMEQLNKHFASLSSSSSSSSSSRTRTTDEKEFVSQKSLSSSGVGASSSASPELARLEAKILELRKQQRSVVETMLKAANAGDQDLAKECQRRRHAIKEELKHAQDALHKLKTEGSSSSSSRDGSQGHKSSSSSGSSSAKTTASSSSSSRSQKHASEDSSTSHSSSSSGQQSRSKKVDKMPTLCGFLDKGPTEWSERGLISNMKTMRGARERWCEITPDGFLKYYKRRGDPVVRGEIDLSDKTFEVVCEDTKRGREFILSTDTQQSHFFTKSSQELEKWVKTLRAANKYLVMNNQLDTLAGKAEAMEKRNGYGGSSSRNGGGRKAAEESYPEEDEQFYGRATLGF